MAFIVELADDPRYVPDIGFPEGQRKFLWKPGRSQRSMPYEAGEVPPEAFLEGQARTIPDFVPINSFIAVCPEVRDVIESLEPGRHQFVPVRIRRRRGDKPIFRLDGRVLADEPYYLFYVTTFLDSIWVERSNVEVSAPTNLIMVAYSNYNIVLHKEIIAGHHVWREGRMATPALLFSDELMALLNARRFKKLDTYHLKEE